MADQWWNDDDQLMAVLQDALNAAADMPPEFVDAGKAAYAWRTIDADLAALTYDSAWDADQLSTATRTEHATLRALTFASDELTIEVEITDDAVLGQIMPTQAGSVTISVVDGPELGPVPIDELGFFVVRPVPAGAFRLLCRTASGATAITGWVSP
jgi:hypothetical protein